MKKLLLLILPVFFLLVNTQAQSDMDKIMQEYQKLLSDPALKYGKDKAAGKY